MSDVEKVSECLPRYDGHQKNVWAQIDQLIFGQSLSARLRKRDVQRYFLWRTRGDRLRQSLMTQVYGERTSKEFAMLASDSLSSNIAAAPSERGFQCIQYFKLRHRHRRCINTAQVAKLPFVDIYHPIADDEVLSVALQLPPHQLTTEYAYRQALGTYFPDLAAIPWTFTSTSCTVSAPAVVLKKVAQLTLGQWLQGTSLGNHPLIRARRYYTNYSLWTRGPLRPFVEETLLSPEANATGLFNPDGLRALVRDHMEGRKDATAFLGGVLAIALWTRMFYAPSTPIRPSGLEIRP